MEFRKRVSKQNKSQTLLSVKADPNKGKQPYIPLELSRTILQSIECPYRIVNSDDQMYVKAYHGQAALEFKNGTTYKGKLYNGLIHGEGTLCWNNEQTYSGSFANNKAHGKGKLKAGQVEYEGSFQCGMRHGIGTLRTDSVVYEGQWRKGKMQGDGKLTFKDGEYYIGKFNQGAKHGTGTYQYKDGSVYTGQWVDNKREGKGILKSTHASYQGDWLNDQPRGFAVVIWYDEDSKKTLRNRYEGQIVNKFREGFGSFYYSNLSVFVGLWKNNCKNGLGYFISEHGEFSSAIYKNDRVQSVIASAPLKLHQQLNGIDNHYHSLLDINSELLERQLEDVGIVCLRFNSQLKSWYRQHSTVSNERYVSFMCACDLWSFTRQFKLLELGDSIPRLNRTLLNSKQSRVALNILPQHNFDYILDKVRTIQDYDELYFIYHAENIESNRQRLQKYQPIDLKKLDIHSPNRPVSFREFVNILVQLAIQKAKKHDRCPAQVLVELFQRCQKIDEAGKRSYQRSFSRESLTASTTVHSGFLAFASKQSTEHLDEIFLKLSSNSHERLCHIDRTITLHELSRYVRLGALDPTTKYKFYKYFIKPYDMSHSDYN